MLLRGSESFLGQCGRSDRCERHSVRQQLRPLTGSPRSDSTSSVDADLHCAYFLIKSSVAPLASILSADMPESTWSRPGEGTDTTPSEWIKSNMFGDTYTVSMGRPLTDPEIRFQKCLEKLPVPSWYLTYSKKKPSIRLNCIPFDKRQPTWKNVKAPTVNNQRKSPKKRSPKSSPTNSDSESPANSRADSGFNETYRISRRTPKRNKSPCISITSSSSDDEPESPKLASGDTTLSAELSLCRTPRQPSFTFPRITPSRKIQNLNIVFEKPFPPRNDEIELLDLTDEARTVYTKTKEIKVSLCDSTDSAAVDRTHTSFLIADVDPGGIHTRIQVTAGLATPSPGTSPSSSDGEPAKLANKNNSTPKPGRLPPRCSPSPNTRFFTSRKKSTALEKIVQGNLGNPRGNLVQDIIGELEQSSNGDDFVRSMVSALEESFGLEDGQYPAEAYGDLESGSDSELANSVDISIKSSGGEESADDQPTTPLPRVPSPGASSSESEEEVHWIPTWLSKLPRTSSRISMLSRASGRSSIGTAGRSSPGLSPIRHECPEDWFVNPARAWGYTYSAKKNRSPMSLFRIDETGNLDSGYSDTASSRRTAPSRTATVGSANTASNVRYTSSSSIASSANTLVEQEFTFNDRTMNKSGPYVLKSFMV